MIRRPQALYEDLPGTLRWFGVPLTHTDGCVKPVNLTQHSTGYFMVTFDRERTYLHRLVLRWRLGRRLAIDEVARHRCGNRACVNPWDIREGTHADNMADQYRHGTRVFGERHPAAKLNNEELAELKLRLASGERVNALARELGLSHQHVATSSQVDGAVVTLTRLTTANSHVVPNKRRNSMRTLNNAIQHFGVDVDVHHEREALIPVFSGLQAQGDVMVVPAALTLPTASTLVPAVGVAVVRGEAGGNTHLLLADGPVFFDAIRGRSELTLGVVTVPVGSIAYLAHPEHAYAGLAPGSYELRRQREQADVIRMVAD